MPLVLLAVCRSAVADSIVFTADTTINDGDLAYENYDVTVQGCTLTINGAHAFNSLTVERNAGNQPGIVTHSAGFTNGTVNGFVLTIAGDVSIQGPDGSLAGSRIDVTARGYLPASGPGAGTGHPYVAGGGGHAGRGAPSSGGAAGGGAYDDVKGPNQHGSGGGNTSWAPGGAGGGCVLLNAGGALVVDGLIAANGDNGQPAYDTQASGAGAGGTIRVVANHVAGTGTISANGGYGRGSWNGTSGAGGGGRISVQSSTSAFAGVMVAVGDSGGVVAGAGTTCVITSEQINGRLETANLGAAGEYTPSLVADAFDEVVVRNGARLLLAGGGVLSAGLLRVAQGGSVVLETTADFGEVLVESGGVIAPTAGNGDFHLQVAGDVHVLAGGTLDATARGYAAASGPGAGLNEDYYASGAGHGGTGGASTNGAAGGLAYGSRLEPVEMGSGGGTTIYTSGGAGGGAIRVTATGALIVDGTIEANGAAGQSAYGLSASGGGSGGSIYLSAGTLTGGAGPLGAGGGSGGRIAVYTCDQQMGPAQITVTGGAGFEAGESGTAMHVSPYIEITQQPVGHIVFPGEATTLSVVATTSQGLLMYQWAQDGVDLTDDPPHRIGTDSAALQISAAVLADQGAYDVLLSDDCGNVLSDVAYLIVPPPGDMNCDGMVDFGDINPFVLALSNPSAYGQQFPQCRLLQADIDGNGSAGFEDINPFVALLTGLQ